MNGRGAVVRRPTSSALVRGDDGRSVGRGARIWLAALLLIAAAIHVAVAPKHFQERLEYGGFFLGAALFQVSIAVGLLRSPTLSGRLYRTALWGSLGIVALWIITRMITPPLATTPEEVSVAGVAATGAELAAIIGLLIVIPPRNAAAGDRGTLAIAWGVVAGLGFGLLFALASSTLVYPSAPLPTTVGVPSLTVSGEGLGPQSPWLTLVLSRHLYIHGAPSTFAFLVVASALLALAVALAVPVERHRTCRATRAGWLSLAPALLAVPSCCSASLITTLGAGLITPLLGATPWILLATTALLLVQVAALWRRYRRLPAQRARPAAA